MIFGVSQAAFPSFPAGPEARKDISRWRQPPDSGRANRPPRTGRWRISPLRFGQFLRPSGADFSLAVYRWFHHRLISVGPPGHPEERTGARACAGYLSSSPSLMPSAGAWERLLFPSKFHFALTKFPCLPLLSSYFYVLSSTIPSGSTSQTSSAPTPEPAPASSDRPSPNL